MVCIVRFGLCKISKILHYLRRGRVIRPFVVTTVVAAVVGGHGSCSICTAPYSVSWVHMAWHLCEPTISM